MWDRTKAVEYYLLVNDLDSAKERIAKINKALSGNLMNAMYAAFHGIRATSKAPEHMVPKLEAERHALNRRVERLKQDIETLLELNQEQAA